VRARGNASTTFIRILPDMEKRQGGGTLGDILNFNPDRELAFDPTRRVDFDPGRSVAFDPSRSLSFHPNRDLGFGHRGIVFRGYVCPICGALVAEDARRCDECGTSFDGRERAAGPAMPPAPAPPARRPTEAAKSPRAKEPAGTVPPPPPAAGFCAFCGAKLHPGDRYCWSCGSRSVGQKEVVNLPPRKETPVAREWK